MTLIFILLTLSNASQILTNNTTINTTVMFKERHAAISSNSVAEQS